MFIQIVYCVIGASLSVVLTKIFIQNGSRIQELGQLMQKSFERTDREIEESRKETRELLERMDKGLEKIAELIVVESKGIKQDLKAAK